MLWEARPAPARGPRPRLTLDAIIQVATTIADADGLPAVTMARVADGLGVTKMALYRYVRSREQLVMMMVDGSLAGQAPLEGEGWRERLADWTRRTHRQFVEHPWTLTATVGPRAVGPHEVDWVEQALRALHGAPMDGGQRMDTVATLAGHARAIALQTAAGMGELGITSAYGRALRDQPERYPALRQTLSEGQQHRDQALEFGLSCILDGLAVVFGETRTAVPRSSG